MQSQEASAVHHARQDHQNGNDGQQAESESLRAVPARVERFDRRPIAPFELLHIRIPVKFCQNSGIFSQFFRNSETGLRGQVSNDTSLCESRTVFAFGRIVSLGRHSLALPRRGQFWFASQLHAGLAFEQAFWSGIGPLSQAAFRNRCPLALRLQRAV